MQGRFYPARGFSSRASKRRVRRVCRQGAHGSEVLRLKSSRLYAWPGGAPAGARRKKRRAPPPESARRAAVEHARPSTPHLERRGVRLHLNEQSNARLSAARLRADHSARVTRSTWHLSLFRAFCAPLLAARSQRLRIQKVLLCVVPRAAREERMPRSKLSHKDFVFFSAQLWRHSHFRSRPSRNAALFSARPTNEISAPASGFKAPYSAVCEKVGDVSPRRGAAAPLTWLLTPPPPPPPPKRSLVNNVCVHSASYSHPGECLES